MVMSYDQIGKIIHTFILRTFKYTYVTNSKKPFVQLCMEISVFKINGHVPIITKDILPRKLLTSIPTYYCKLSISIYS